jgi:hypothetical protein
MQAPLGHRGLDRWLELRQSDTILAEFLDATLQLDELRAAEWSPIRRSDEYQHRPARSHNRLQVADAPSLIAQVEIGNT